VTSTLRRSSEASQPLEISGVSAQRHPAYAAVDPDFRRDRQPLSLAGDRAAEQDLVVPGAVGVGGVEKGDAEVNRAVDSCD
jgi:hypothetical protein